MCSGQCHASPVPTSLTFSEHLAALESSGTRLAEFAVEAGMDAPVPTCPTWEIDAVGGPPDDGPPVGVAHVRGDEPDSVRTRRQILAAGRDLPA